MAATKYMVLYRYVNEATNMPITNDPSNEYNPVEEFYTDCHKLYGGNEAQQEEGYQEQQEIITNAVDVNNPKYGMLFAYNGTKKIKHPGADGTLHSDEPYLVRDTYKRISGSPWLTNCVCASLDAALEKARKLVAMIGKENVKLIKVVAFDQFLKIK